MKELWESRTPPIALAFPKDLPLFDDEDDQKVWPLSAWIALFKSSLDRLSHRPCPIFFDKDDQDTLDLVASASNIRAHIFGISLTSRFTIKSMAGNIIPAIATTNAIAAGMIVLQSFNILQNKLMDCSTVPFLFQLISVNFWTDRHL